MSEQASLHDDLLTKALKEIEAQPSTDPASSHLAPGDRCPQCGGRLVLRMTERGELLGCSNYPACNFVRHLPAAPLSILVTLPVKCPQCGAPLTVKRGRFGIFICCQDYPQCRFSVQEQQPTTFKCPQCGKGELVKRQARSGRVFYGCTNYPSCDFVVPGEPVARPCPDCGFPLRYKKKVKAGIALYCPNPLCKARHQRHKELLASA